MLRSCIPRIPIHIQIIIVLINFCFIITILYKIRNSEDIISEWIHEILLFLDYASEQSKYITAQKNPILMLYGISSIGFIAPKIIQYTITLFYLKVRFIIEMCRLVLLSDIKIFKLDSKPIILNSKLFEKYNQLFASCISAFSTDIVMIFHIFRCLGNIFFKM